MDQVILEKVIANIKKKYEKIKLVRIASIQQPQFARPYPKY